ncbi:MAG: hypothetical protein AMXMBFR76_16450 [Pseudomonadota bacterium]
MIKQRIDVLDTYAESFRRLVNDRVWEKDEDPAILLCLNSKEDWNFVCVAMDIVGDASLAIGNFLAFGLDGPSRYEDMGEKYLRLYGVLSAAYMQQQAVLKLYSLMNCPSPKEVQSTFRMLEVTALRHQLASHSLDFLAPGSNSKQAFVPVRVGLAGFTCEVTGNCGDRTVKLDEAIDEHTKAVIDVLDKTFEKSAKTLFKGQDKKLKEWKETLEDLRFERDGNLIIRGGSGDKKHVLRITSVAPESRRITSRSTRSRAKTHSPG